MKQLQIGLLEKELTFYQIRHYESQMPETRRKLHQLAKHLVHDCEIPILQIAKELNVDRGKIYRMLDGSDVDLLPARWAKEEEETIRKMYGKASNQEIAKILNRTISGVCYRVRALGIGKRGGYWKRKLSASTGVNLKAEPLNEENPVLIVVPTCNHFWKMVTKNYYKCSWCDKKHYA